MAPVKYNRVTSAIADELRRIVGDRYVVFGDAEKLQPYSHDEVPDPHYAHMPECLVRPDTPEQIAAIMKLANRELIPVTPRGAGSGLSGGAVPVFGGIVLLCDRMNRILDIDPANMMVVVEPGVVTNAINEALAEHGLFYAGYPMSLETCFIGGNVAENAGGGKAIKYGVTARYVTGLELVTPTGEIAQMGGKLVKDVTGYNLIQLMVGSEGTLGIFTKITLKLLPLPKASVDLLVLFDSDEAAVAAVPRVQTAAGIIPTAIELMDRSAFVAACGYLNEKIPYKQAGAMLLITLDGQEASQLEAQYDAVGELCLDAGAIEVYVADNSTTSERIWRIRRNVAEALALAGGDQSNEDLVVPPAAVAELIAEMKRLEGKYGVSMAPYGHAGDGNIHSRIVKPEGMRDDEWPATLAAIQKELYESTVAMGGRLSGEHGIGHKRKQFLPMFLSAAEIEMMRAIKRAIDPNNVLNPGKILDVD
jgi:glycolate oxidase